MDDLKRRGLPKKDDFFFFVENKSISDEEYEVVKSAWRDNRMSTLYDLLKWFNLLDVHKFLESVLVYLELYQNRGFNLC